MAAAAQQQLGKATWAVLSVLLSLLDSSRSFPIQTKALRQEALSLSPTNAKPPAMGSRQQFARLPAGWQRFPVIPSDSQRCRREAARHTATFQVSLLQDAIRARRQQAKKLPLISLKLDFLIFLLFLETKSNAFCCFHTSWHRGTPRPCTAAGCVGFPDRPWAGVVARAAGTIYSRSWPGHALRSGKGGSSFTRCVRGVPAERAGSGAVCERVRRSVQPR